jgi:hypothetical protein
VVSPSTGIDQILVSGGGDSVLWITRRAARGVQELTQRD